MHTYSILYQPYERFECSAPVTKRFKAPSKKHAIIKADPNYGWGCGKWPEGDDEDIQEELQNALSLSEEELLDNLHTCNGDGTDFLFELKDETTGEVIFEDGGYEGEEEDVEDWDEAYEEYDDAEV